MEDRLREIEIQFAKLTTSIRGAIWTGGIIGAIIIALLGWTNFVSAPAAAKKALDGAAVHETLSGIEKSKVKIEAYEKQAKKQSEAIKLIASKYNSGALTFQKQCVDRTHNNCDPWKALKQCSPGFVDAGITEENFWSGGKCGTGSVCRVCYKFN